MHVTLISSSDSCPGPCQLRSRRDGRVVEGARLESVYRGNSIEGSNPSLSAIPRQRISLDRDLTHDYGGTPQGKGARIR